MATFKIYDSAGAGAYMPYADVTVGGLVGSYRAQGVLGDDGQWLLADMEGSNIDVAIHYAIGSSTVVAKDMGFLVGGTVIGEIAGVNLVVNPSKGETYFNKIANAGDDTMEGNNYSDLIHGGWGNDVVIGWAGDDSLYGDEGTDVLVGGGGNDYMNGGAGYDGALYLGNSWEYTFIRQSNGDVIVSDKVGGYGVDYLTGVEEIAFDNGRFSVDALAPLPQSPVPQSPAPQPAAPPPQVSFYGTAGKDYLTGNAIDNKLYGSAGNDVLKGAGGNDHLYGGKGADELWGGTGKDAFVFNTSPTSGRDAIKDFRVVDDTINLDNAFFTKVGGNGWLKAGAFWSNNTGKAHDKDDRVIYDKDSGVLYYDADGSGHGAALSFATIGKNLALTHKDFFIL